MSQDPGSRAAQRVLEMEARGVSTFEHRSCTGKVTYLSRRLARLAARQLRPKYRDKLRPYRCPHCELFHLTKTTNHYRARSAAVHAPQVTRERTRGTDEREADEP